MILYKKLFAAISTIVTLFVAAYIMTAQTNDDCLNCHNESDITMEKNGKKISLYVQKFALARSVHNKHKCVDCHVKYDPDAIPHNENKQQINCQSCHKNTVLIHKFHPNMKNSTGVGGTNDINCKGCHGYHEITSVKSPKSKLHFTKSTEFCGNCHKDEMKMHYKSQHFVEVSKHNPIAPTCIYCHKNEITKGFRLDLARLKRNQEKMCLGCHLNNPSSQQKYAKYLVNFEQSVHGKALLRGNQNAANCIDCHGSHDLQKATSATSKINRYKVPDICGKCHISISREYDASTHGIALKKGCPDVPGCTYCHGEHAVKPMVEVTERVITENRMNFHTITSNKMIYCVECHTNSGMMKKYGILTIQHAHDWLPNIDAHWETVRCVDCHSSYDPPNLSHNLLPPEKTIKKCEQCHSKNSILMTKLYKHEKTQSRQKLGFINGTLLSDAYVIGTTRNVFLDVISFGIVGIVVLGIGIHGMMRWYFRKSTKFPASSHKVEQSKQDENNI